MPDEGEEAHRLEDDMARSMAVRVICLVALFSLLGPLRIEDSEYIYPSSCLMAWLMHM